MGAFPARNPHYDGLCRSATPLGAATAFARHCIARVAQDV